MTGGRVRVVELLATGSNGGAQEHLYSLVTRIDQARYDVSVVALSAGSAVRKLERAGIPVLVIDEVDDAIAVGALATHLSEVRADVLHTHMYRADTVGTRAVMALGEIGHRRPYIVSTVHSSRVRSNEDQALLAGLTPHMDRLIAVSRSIERKLAPGGPGRDPGGPHLQRRRPPALRPPGALLHAARRVRDGARLADRRGRREAGAREGPPDPLRRVADRAAHGPGLRTCWSSARAAAATRSRRRPASCGSPIGWSSPAAATTSRP